MRAIVTTLLFASIAVSAAGQQAGTPDRWSAFEFFIGAWTGEESATFGDGRGRRTYELVLQDRYLLSRNRSVFPPQDGLPDGDDHEDWTVVSYDDDRDNVRPAPVQQRGVRQHVRPRRRRRRRRRSAWCSSSRRRRTRPARGRRSP